MNPVELHPTWNVIDSTKVGTFMECPREFFYQYILGWRSEGLSIHLEFGVAWHLAQERLARGLKEDGKYTTEALTEAYELFYNYYRDCFPPELDDAHRPKDPANALEALTQYVERYKDDSFEVMFTEVAGAVPVSEDAALHFKIDMVKQDVGGIYCVDHKTTGRDSQAWQHQWELSFQLFTYVHVLFSAFDETDIFGAEINGAILRKGGNDFRRIPVRKTMAQMMVWQWHAELILKAIRENVEQLMDASDADDMLTAFPMNTTACCKYSVCPYHAFCCSWPNPLRRCGEVQPGFQQDFWDPRQQAETAKYTLKGEQIVEK